MPRYEVTLLDMLFGEVNVETANGLSRYISDEKSEKLEGVRAVGARTRRLRSRLRAAWRRSLEPQ
jgi:hypothetical protein